MTNLIFGTSATSSRQSIALLIGRIALGAVLIAHGWQNLPVAQVAVETGASVAAVKQQLARGRKSLAHLLSDEPAGEQTGQPPKGVGHD